MGQYLLESPYSQYDTLTSKMAKSQKGLFAIFEARPKSFHTKPLCAFDDCVHFEDHTPSAESA